MILCDGILKLLKLYYVFIKSKLKFLIFYVCI